MKYLFGGCPILNTFRNFMWNSFNDVWGGIISTKSTLHLFWVVLYTSTVDLYYSFNQPVFDKVKLMLSLSFENMVTFTKYKGYDPEATTFTDNNL